MMNETDWPSVDEAYAFVLPSYQMLTARFEAADTRLTTLLTFTSTVTLGVPLFAKSLRPTIDFGSGYFVMAMLLFAVIEVVGLVGRVRGGLALPDPMVLYEQYLDASPWMFRKDLIFFAGQHFQQNLSAIWLKRSCAVAMTVCFFCETVALIFWIARA